VAYAETGAILSSEGSRRIRRLGANLSLLVEACGKRKLTTHAITPPTTSASSHHETQQKNTTRNASRNDGPADRVIGYAAGRENATIVVSGARVAREIGVPRSTVWKWVERLREMGVRVKGHPRTGFFGEVPEFYGDIAAAAFGKAACYGEAHLPLLQVRFDESRGAGIGTRGRTGGRGHTGRGTDRRKRRADALAF